jgi:hypothetical protein
MTDIAVDASIEAWDDPGSPQGELITKAEMAGTIRGLLGRIRIADIAGTRLPGSVIKSNPENNGLIWAPDLTSDAGTGWDSNGSLSDNRVVQMNGRKITLKKLAPDLIPSLEFETDQTDNNVTTHWWAKSPTEGVHSRAFGLLTVSTLNPAVPVIANSFNDVAKLGHNPDRFWEPTKNGLWDAWEPHWISGDLLYLERHVSIDAAAFPGEKRLYSILTMLRNSWPATDIVQNFRGTTYNLMDPTDNTIFTIGKQGGAAIKTQIISPSIAALTLEVGGTLGNGVAFYMFDNGGTFDWLANKWQRIYFRNAKLNVDTPVFADNASALAAPGMQVGDLYEKPDGGIYRLKAA